MRIRESSESSFDADSLAKPEVLSSRMTSQQRERTAMTSYSTTCPRIQTIRFASDFGHSGLTPSEVPSNFSAVVACTATKDTLICVCVCVCVCVVRRWSQALAGSVCPETQTAVVTEVAPHKPDSSILKVRRFPPAALLVTRCLSRCSSAALITLALATHWLNLPAPASRGFSAHNPHTHTHTQTHTQSHTHLFNSFLSGTTVASEGP